MYLEQLYYQKNLLDSSWEANHVYIATFVFIINLMFKILHSAILVPNNSFIMLINTPLFQHYSHQICYLLFSILCWDNRLWPTWMLCSNYQESKVTVTNELGELMGISYAVLKENVYSYLYVLYIVHLLLK